MSTLAGVPVPSIDQIIIGAELVIILYPVRMLMHWVDNEGRRNRNYIIRAHVKSGHMSRLKHCLEGQCANLRSLQPPSLASPQLETVPEIDLEVDP